MHDLDAEASLIGAALLTVEAAEVLATRTRRTDIYGYSHGLVADAVRALHGRGVKPEPISVAAELRRIDRLDEVGGLGTLVALQTECRGTNRRVLEHHARIVRDLGTLRQLAAIGATITRWCCAPGADPEVELDRAARLIAGAADIHREKTP